MTPLLPVKRQRYHSAGSVKPSSHVCLGLLTILPSVSSAEPKPEREHWRPGGSQMEPRCHLMSHERRGRRVVSRRQKCIVNQQLQRIPACSSVPHSALQGQTELKNEFVSGRPPLTAAEKAGIRANEAPLRPIRAVNNPAEPV